MVNSWFPGLGPLANACKPGFYQDSRKPLVSSGIVGNAYFHLVFTRGKAGKQVRPRGQNSSFFPAIYQVFPQVAAWFLVGSQLSPRFFPG